MERRGGSPYDTQGLLPVTPERATFAVVIAVLLTLVAAIGYLWAQPRQPPSVTVERIGTSRVAGTQVYVTGEVHNSGDETAEAVQVTAELTVEGQVVAEGEQSVDFLSGGETEQIVFVFDRALPTAEAELRVASYKVP